MYTQFVLIQTMGYTLELQRYNPHVSGSAEMAR